MKLTTVQRKALKVLRAADGPLTSKEIAAAGKMKLPGLAMVLKALANKGLAGQNADKTWVIVPDSAKPKPPPTTDEKKTPGLWDTCQLQPDRAILVLRDKNGGVSAFTGVVDKPDQFKVLPHVVRHSPEGFEYGYAGSGPADLALSVCSFFLPGRYAHAYYQDFKRDFVVLQTGTQWGVTGKSFYEWFKKVAQHQWRKREITKGQDAGTVLPERCSNCGEVKRRDGRHGPCGKGSANRTVLPALNNRVGMEADLPTGQAGYENWQEFLATAGVERETCLAWRHVTHGDMHYLVAPTGAVLMYAGVKGSHAWAQVKEEKGDDLLKDCGYLPTAGRQGGPKKST